ncbi:uncharacterized protein LOC127254623 isoform X2 [Andrographis paniculata]|uniref:uncharacterized protein LOC127254623 isoform X2 n=1 Tax=Andrographis paniculata TaxID=175694 RepID=UPI0021E9689A|nr:uncharacterized protein LOC127254623 isoform X2 [Andrographis paniculata]
MLKDARVVEECCTIINKKEVNCLRLLKSFSPSIFEPKRRGLGHDDMDMDQSMNLLQRGQTTEQVVELPILRQIYDMIDAAGSKGLTNLEVCKRLGLCSKEYHKRYFKQMIFRFGLHLQLESHKKGEVYRVWTANNFNNKSSSKGSLEKEKVLPEVHPPTSRNLDMDCCENLSQSLQVLDNSTSMGSVKAINRSEIDAVGTTEATNGTTVEEDASTCLLLECNPHNSDEELRNGRCDKDLLKDNKLVVADSGIVKICSPAITRPSRRRPYPMYPHLTISATSSLREQRILKMLQEEKILIKPELHRHLESLEEEKNTMMDKKTLERILNKLQQEGHCKCINVSVPVLTNCGNSRTTDVILHPSVYNVSPELLTQIHDKMRSFEIRVRKQSYAKQKKGQSVPILDRVQRIPNNVKLDVQSERAELMRANGFVLAKMVRVKLLHNFLWGWIYSYSGWDDTLLSCNTYNSKNSHSSCKLFKLDMAIRSMPLELFLQVVGSVKKFEDMVEKCRRGVLLSDLPMEEYKGLMDTRATGRLSWLIDILRRLKLIRLVSKDHADDEGSSQCTTLTHALELKPYIEEPVSIVTASGFIFPDLRPQVRHDFIFSSSKAVAEYWNTLEYCYATAKSTAALLAFPGSAVQEVFHSRAWASVRVMTAEQRVKLLERVANDDLNGKLSFRHCKEIAKDLNLTLEQVLRVYYDKRQQRLTRHQRDLDGHEQDLHTRKRKRRPDKISSKLITSNVVDGQSSVSDVDPVASLDDDQFTEEQCSLLSVTEDYDFQLHKYYAGDPTEEPDELNLNEENEVSTFIHNRAFSTSTRQKRFLWADESDRQLVMEYARYRAALGAKFHRVDWTSILNLPSSPDACKRRMANLKSYPLVRKALMKLCNILADRYAKYLETCQDKMLNHEESGEMLSDPSHKKDSLCSSEYMYEQWADFDENTIKIALDDVLRNYKMAKLEGRQDTSSHHRNNDLDDCGETKTSRSRSRSQQLSRKYMKLLKGSRSISRQMHESVAIANAAELFKLIFLSNSKAPEGSTLLAETLRRYSEHDLFAAFSYLREKKIMIGGSCNSPFVLSQLFLQSISSSPFPSDTGKRADKFANWLDEKAKDLMEEGVDAPSDMQCGEILTLCALVSSGEMSITPCLPNEGVGEAEETRASKRKHDNSELDSGEVFKKAKASFAGEGEITSRREKGFPGIKVLLHREAISRTLAIESFKDGPLSATPLFCNFGGKDSSNILLGLDCNSGSSDLGLADYEKELFDSGGVAHPAANASESSPWEAMTDYSKYLMSPSSHEVNNSYLQPQLLKTLYSAIQKSGDNGLSMKEIDDVLQVKDDKILEVMIEVLEAFGRVLKVNAYDSVHVVDSLYRSKYFLTSISNHTETHLRNQEKKVGDGSMPLDVDNHGQKVVEMGNESDKNSEEEHRVTILNRPEDVADAPESLPKDTDPAGCQHDGVAIPKTGTLNLHAAGARICSPLLPWMNGDGTVNEAVYKGLVRRVLGIVMQNPGILEDEIINQMDSLNPQSCRQLLEMLVLDNHIVGRKKQQMSSEPPSILAKLLGNKLRKSELICRLHYFANPMSSNLL